MKALTLFFVGLMFAGCTSIGSGTHPDRGVASSSAGYLDPHDLAIINLTNISIIDNENQNSFPYSVQPINSVPGDLLQKLLKESGSDVILSRIFATQSLPTYKNIYVFISQEIVNADQSTFKLNVTFENSKGHFSTLHYRITQAQQRVLNLEIGPSDEAQKMEVHSDTSFFPY